MILSVLAVGLVHPLDTIKYMFYATQKNISAKQYAQASNFSRISISHKIYTLE